MTNYIKKTVMLPTTITLKIALKDGIVVDVPDCTVTWNYNEESRQFLPVHTRETALKIGKIYKEGHL